MSDILMVGGAGFTGSNFVNYMMQHTKYKVSTIDNLRVGSLQNLAPAQAAKNRHSFYLADVKDKYISKKIFQIEKPKTVIYNCLQFKGYLEEEIDVMKDFISVAKEAFCVRNFVVLLPSKVPVTMQFEVRQILKEEFETKNVHFSKEFKWFVINPCNVFGPRQSEGKAVEIIKTHLSNPEAEELEDKYLELISKQQEWMYIKDYFIKFMNLLDGAEDKTKSGIYILSTGQWASEKDIYHFVDDVLKEREERHTWDTNLGNPGEYNFDLVSALEHTIVWYDKNRWSWR